MKKIKIFTALNHLGTYELNRFDKFIKSPYFNSNSALKEILSLYIKERKNKNSNIDNKTALWQVAFPNKPFNDGRLRKALSDLLKLYEDFLCQELLEQKPLHRATLLMEAVEKRKLVSLYNSSMRRAGLLTHDNTDASAQLYYHRFQVEKYYYELTDFDLKRTEKSNLANIVNSLDYFYLAEKLKYYCTSISQKVFIEHNYEFLFIEEIKQHIKEHQYADVPIVNIWVCILFLQTGNKEEMEFYFKEFKNTFKRLSGTIDIRESARIFTYGHNHCIRSINQGKETYFNELFQLYKEALISKIYLEENILDPVVYRNIVTVALRLKELNWTDNFIDEYSEYIVEEFRANAVGYSKAALKFYQGKYSEVLDNLNQMKVMDISYELNSKSLLIMTYFEMNETGALDSLLDSFYVYLNRHKDISKPRRELYQNLISFTRRLMNALPSDKGVHEKILIKLGKTKGIASKAWLKEKIMERL